MSKRFIVFTASIIVILLIFVGVQNKTVKDNKIYSVKDDSTKKDISGIVEKINSEGMSSFINIDYSNFQQEKNSVLLTISPDKKSAYFLLPSIMKKSKEEVVLKGDAAPQMSLMKMDIETKKSKIIAQEIPFVSDVKWNSEGSMAAFIGGKRLTLYDCKNDKLFMEDKLSKEIVNYAEFSPDGKKLYTEHSNIPNGSIIYIDSKKFVQPYETKEEVYYKGKLDNNYYYATKKNTVYYTAVLNKKGDEVKALPKGRFRDSYKRSVLQVGEQGFGLQLIKDINNSKNAIELTKEFIFDAKFIYDGKVVYITANKDAEKNEFFMHIVDANGKEIKKIEVSGNQIAIEPSGKMGLIGGDKMEKISFLDNTIKTMNTSRFSKEEEDMFKVVRGAMDICYKHEIMNIVDEEGAKKYFIDSHNPEQWAYFDVMTKFKDKIKFNFNNERYIVNVYLNSYNISDDKNRAELNVRINAENSKGMGLSTENQLELIKINGKWYVTGLSTFTSSKAAGEVKRLVEQYVKELKKGSLFEGKLKEKEIEIGQIQFWQISEPHLAANIDYSNYCKVYLKVKENNSYTIYKMILNKKNQSLWQPIKLDKENLSNLL